ncbi:MAG: hydrogenase 4 subunit B, partial [Casimicrobiaceae bacterium]
MSGVGLTVTLAAVLGWMVIGVLGLVRFRDRDRAGRALFAAGALVAIVLAGTALATLGAPAETRVLPLGLPDLPFHLRFD